MTQSTDVRTQLWEYWLAVVPLHCTSVFADSQEHSIHSIHAGSRHQAYIEQRFSHGFRVGYFCNEASCVDGRVSSFASSGAVCLRKLAMACLSIGSAWGSFTVRGFVWVPLTKNS